jgi:hypothetical protein
VRITDRDRLLLQFAAEHRIVLGAHFQALLGVTPGAVGARLAAHMREGLLRRETVLDAPGRCYLITRPGLATIESDLPVPRFDPRGYRHDLGLAWVWLAARAGAFGSLRELVSERRMRSRDAAEMHPGRAHGAIGDPFAVRLGGIGVGGRERLHYPDLLLVGRDARRFAVELELTPKSRTRRERILAGYAADGRIDAVVYLVERRSVGRGVEASAARLGIRDRVRVQTVRWGAQGQRPTRTAADRARARAPRGRRVEAGR